ncbi:MAG: PglZ domain-containing protein, partial [Armatimonadota bacterium]
MILAALTEEFRALFSRQAQARIALWFDEKRDFERLLPAIEKHLSGHRPAPFTLLRYDEAPGHGQLWIKHQIHWATRDLPTAERDARRYVLYLPFPAERLDGPEEEGGFTADLLLEYRYQGATWLVDGKKPTLFAFLRRVDVKLPSDAKEQRILWDGGRDSLLAKFAARFAERDARFWEHAVTPAWARQQVIGDVEQTILDLAAEPAERLGQLVHDELITEFVQQVRDAFGFSHPIPLPDDQPSLSPNVLIDEWLADLVLRLALTETYEAYGEPADFSFASLLPELSYRPRCVQFLKRWLKDGSAAGDYHRLIRRVEREYDLSAWAKGRTGTSFAFPHLTRLRFQIFYDQFRAAAKQKTQYVPLLRAHAKELGAEADFTRASPEPLRGFELLQRLAHLVIACEEAIEKALACATPEEVVSLYLGYAGCIDRAHWRLVADVGKEADLEEVIAVANRAYGEYLTRLNGAFFEGVRARDEWTVGGVRPIADVAAGVWSGRRPFAVVIVDALRYDCALDIRERLRLPESALAPALACIPTRTWVGMTALLPLGSEALRFEPGPGEGRIRNAKTGGNFSDRQVRLQFLRERVGATCMEVEEAENTARAPKPLPEVLCVFGHETIDSLGHDTASDLIRHLHVEVERLINLVGKLHKWGYPEVHLLTDHGFVMTSDEIAAPVVAIPADGALVAKARYAILGEGAIVDAKTFPVPLDPKVRVAVPAGMACFKEEKSFAHGGVAVQEVIIPHLVSRKEAAPDRVGVRVLPAAYEVKTHAVKIVLECIPPERVDLFSRPIGRNVEVDLR